MEISEKVAGLLEALQERYASEKQPLENYLEGLLYTQYVDYWDYINLDALLNIQHPRSYIPDEMVFIIYHQITELYFKLTLWEIDQILKARPLTAEFFTARLKRMNSYFGNLSNSFEIMVEGMELEQFMKFRLSLLPASGFQSAQYRMIELASTEVKNLLNDERWKQYGNGSIESMFEHVYWKSGAIRARPAPPSRPSRAA